MNMLRIILIVGLIIGGGVMLQDAADNLSEVKVHKTTLLNSI